MGSLTMELHTLKLSAPKHFVVETLSAVGIPSVHLCCAAVGGDSVVHTLSSGQCVCYPRTEVAGLMGTHTNTLMRASASVSSPVC